MHVQDIITSFFTAQYHSHILDIPGTGFTLPPYTPPVTTPHTVGVASSTMTTPLGGVRGNKVMGFTASDLPSTTFSETATIGKAKGENSSSSFKSCGYPNISYNQTFSLVLHNLSLSRVVFWLTYMSMGVPILLHIIMQAFGLCLIFELSVDTIRYRL